jgi:hypothetical protein
MSGPTVMAGPTMANPNALHTVEELRAALQQANSLVLQLSMHAQDLGSLVQVMQECLTPVLTAHLAGDAEQTKAALDSMVAKHVRQGSAPTGGVH